MNSLWAQQECLEGRVYACSVGQVRIWLMRNSQGWQVASRHEAGTEFVVLHEAPSAAEPPEWQRFVTPSSDSKLRLIPVLPDRPVMSHPEARIEIAPRHKGLFFVTIPVWVRLAVVGADGRKEVPICEVPTRVLSKTWFGHPAEEGEIGYALATRARQSLSELTDVAGRAICPVLVENGTPEKLAFSQFQLSVRHMSVYETDDGKLWTNECKLGYAGGLLSAALTFGRGAPEQAQRARLVSGPREAPTSGLTARSIAEAIFRQPF